MFIINPFYDHITLSRCKVNHYFPFHQTFPHFFHQQTIIIHQQSIIKNLRIRALGAQTLAHSASNTRNSIA